MIFMFEETLSSAFKFSRLVFSDGDLTLMWAAKFGKRVGKPAQKISRQTFLCIGFFAFTEIFLTKSVHEWQSDMDHWSLEWNWRIFGVRVGEEWMQAGNFCKEEGQTGPGQRKMFG